MSVEERDLYGGKVVEDKNWFEVRERSERKQSGYPVSRQHESNAAWNTFTRRAIGLRLECPDDCFHHGSAVMMPNLHPFTEAPPQPHADFPSRGAANLTEVRAYHPGIVRPFVVDPPKPDPQHDLDIEHPDERVAGLYLLALVFKFLELNPDHRLLLAGHADTTGSDETNFEISAQRARGAQFLLEGRSDEWVDLSLSRSKVEDYQRVLLHLAGTCGWGCDPGLIDNLEGPMTRAAVRNFQKMYNDSAQGGKIAVDGIVGRQTWGAIFDLYQNEIASMLGVPPDGLAPLRKGIQYVDPKQPYIACGELYPIEAAGQDDYYSSRNRRVEALFYPRSTPPALGSGPPSRANPPGAGIYGPNAPPMHRLIPVMRGGDPLPPESREEFTILDLDSRADQPPDLTIRFEGGLSSDPIWGFLDDFQNYPVGFGGAGGAGARRGTPSGL